MVRASAILLFASLSTACVASSTPPPAAPAPARPRVAAPPPVDPVRPPPVLLTWCDPEAPRIYVETVRKPNDPPLVKLELTLRERGAWSFAVGSRLLKTGCLLRTQHADFVRALSAASFAAPPPPAVRCTAVPSTYTSYYDMRGKPRAAYAETPCGTIAHRDVYKLSALLHSYVGATPAMPAASTARMSPNDQRCQAMHSWGPMIYNEQTTPLSGRAKPRSLTIYANGAWRSQGYGRDKRGCLDRATVTKIHQLSAAARFRSDPRRRMRCQAVSTRSTTISTPRHSFSFRHPCGVPPDPSLAALRNFVARSVRR